TLPLDMLLLFVVLSVADLVITFLLIKGAQGHIKVSEGNPIAGAWYANYGWPGMIIFKVGIIALVGAVGVYISLHRPDTGRRVLTFACLVVALVVIYSYRLLTQML